MKYEAETKRKLGEFPSEVAYVIDPHLMMTFDDSITEMFLNIDIEVTGTIGDVKFNKIKFQKQHKFSLIEMLKILANNDELNIGLIPFGNEDK